MAIGDTYKTEDVDAEIESVSKELGIKFDPRLVKALARAENMGPNGRYTLANRKSPDNATGVMQVIPSTLAGLKRNGYLPPEFPEDLSSSPLRDQIRAGVATLAEMSATANTTDPYELAAYYHGGNAGLKGYRAQNLQGQPRTQQYLQKVKTAMSDVDSGGTPGYVPPTAATVQGTATPILQAAQNAYAQYQQMAPGVLEALGLSNNVLQTQALAQQGAIQAGGAAAGEAARLNAETAIAEQQLHHELLAAYGLDVRDPQSHISQQFQQKQEFNTQRQAIRNEIDSMQSVSFLENPFAFIMNIPKMQQATVAHNRIADEETKLDADLAKRLATVGTVKSLTASKTADLLRAKAAQDAIVIAQEAQNKVAQSRAQASAGNAKLLLDQLTLTDNMFARGLQLDQALLGRDLQMQNMQERKDARLTKEQETKKGEMLALGINTYRKMIGGNAVTDLTADEVNAMPAELKGAWLEVLARGNFGNNYAESVPFIERFGNLQAAADAGNATMMTLVRSLKTQAEQKIGAIQNDHKAKNEMAGPLSYAQATQLAYSKLFSEHAGIANKGIDKSSISTTNSPYKIDYDSVLLTGKARGVTDNVMLDAVSNIRTLSATAPITDRILVDTVKAQVLAGKIDPARAAQHVSQFYSVMAKETYEDNGLKYFGLPRLADYAITVGATGAKTVDLMSESQLENYFTSQVAQQRRINSSGMMTGRGASMFGSKYQELKNKE